MKYRLRYTSPAKADLERLYAFLAEHDIAATERALDAIERATTVLSEFPFACRKADAANPFLRELVIPFGGAGYVALFEIEDHSTVTALAVRHQREEDYH